MLPTVGAGALPLTPPSETALYDTDKEKTLHTPRSDTWNLIADECSEEGVGVSIFLAPSRYMDTGSICVVSTQTGGEVFWHPRFVPKRDGPMVEGQLRRLVERMQGYNCTTRVRCSNGRPFPFSILIFPFLLPFLYINELPSTSPLSL